MNHILGVLRHGCYGGLSLMALISASASPSYAGTLQDGIWKPSNCGDEPVAPTLHAESSSAYRESQQWVRLYQTQVDAYISCIVKQANADNSTISDVVKSAEHRANDAFRQYNEASHQISRQQPDDDNAPRHHGNSQSEGQGQGGMSFGIGGD